MTWYRQGDQDPSGEPVGQQVVMARMREIQNMRGRWYEQGGKGP